MPTSLMEGPAPYTSFDGDALSLYAWRGQHVALLTASPDLDHGVMAGILEGLDRAYEAYLQITGREPTPSCSARTTLTVRPSRPRIASSILHAVTASISVASIRWPMWLATRAPPSSATATSPPPRTAAL